MRAMISRRLACTLPSTGSMHRDAAKVSRSVRMFSEAQRSKPSEHETGPQPEIDEDFQKEIEAYKANEEKAARLTPGEELRSLVAYTKYGTVSTFSSAGPTKGYPGGALTPYAVDSKGRPVCCLSNLSSHKKDLVADGRATLTVVKDGFKSMADSRCTLTGTFKPVSEEERAACREAYLEAHPDAYWVDFGDFDYLRMDEIVSCNLIGGFGRATKVAADNYLEASADPVAKFSGPICSHMNDDHSDATCAMIRHYAGLQVNSAELLGVDRLGMTAQCKPMRAPNQLVNVRLAFREPAADRKAVKDRIVEMTREAAAAVMKEEEAEANAAAA